jgi:hypothetical protein
VGSPSPDEEGSMPGVNRVPSDQWILILRLSDGVWLGLSAGALYVGDERQPKREVDSKNPIGLLPCLEKPYLSLQIELEHQEEMLSLPKGTFAEQIPLAAIPRAAVATRLDYWIQLALDWLARMPVAAIDQELLSSLSSAEWATQRARHRARSLMGRPAGLQ